MTEQEARELGVEPALRTVRIDLAPTPADVAARADILSVHLALGAGDERPGQRRVLDRLKPGAIFINTARGEVVDYAALAAAVARQGAPRRPRRLRRTSRPRRPAISTTICSALPGVYGTHHIGASTDQAQEAIAAETVRIVRSYKETGKVPNVVNLAKRTPATHMLVVRHRDRPGVLAHVFDHLRGGNLNVQETENIVFEGAEAAVARINLDGAPSAALCDRIKDGQQRHPRSAGRPAVAFAEVAES